MMDLHIIPECFIDTKLVTVLVKPTGHYNHQKGNGTVVRVMKKRFNDEFALGIIDLDKELVAYATECEIIYDCNNGLTLRKHPVANHYFIVHPRIEPWIIDLTDSAGRNLSEFDLPTSVKKLEDITKTSKSDKIDPNAENFRRLFIELRRARLTPILIMTHWITYLKENPYTPDLATLRAGTDRILAGENS